MRKWIPLVIVAAAFIATGMVYSKLPPNVPTHWGLDGQPDRWSSRMWGAWMIPVVILGMWAITRILPAIDPRGMNYAKFRSTFEAIINALMLFMLGLHIVVLRASLGYPVEMNRVMPIGIGALFVVIGNLLPRARPNWFVGIRTPWTLSSDRVWEKTHRLGGRLFVAGGLLCVIAGVFAVGWAHVVLFGSIVAIAISVMVYSYVEWRREGSPVK